MDDDSGDGYPEGEKEEMRTIALTTLAFVVLSGMMMAGCGESGDTEQTENQAESTSPVAEESSQALPESSNPQPVLKTVADFPDDQDGAEVEAVIKTVKGDIVLQFYPDVAPVTVASFLNLARSGFYNGTRFHRVVKEPEPFVIQGGDPKSRDPNAPDVGTGGPGYYIPAEFSERPHLRGTLSMARSQDPNSGGSQFFICLADTPFLDGQYTVFGDVVSGMEVVDAIEQGDVMNEIIVRPKT